MPPTGNVTVSAMFPVPDAVQLAPLDATHDHVAPDNDASNVSVTVTPVAFDGPLFVATIVYVTDVPGTSLATPSVFDTATSAVRPNVSVSVAELFPGVESVTPLGTLTVAAFDNEPVAAALIVAVKV